MEMVKEAARATETLLRFLQQSTRERQGPPKGSSSSSARTDRCAGPGVPKKQHSYYRFGTGTILYIEPVGWRARPMKPTVSCRAVTGRACARVASDFRRAGSRSPRSSAPRARARALNKERHPGPTDSFFCCMSRSRTRSTIANHHTTIRKITIVMRSNLVPRDVGRQGGSALRTGHRREARPLSAPAPDKRERRSGRSMRLLRSAEVSMSSRRCD